MEKNLTIFDLLNKPATKKALEKVVPEYMTPDRMLNLAVNCLDKSPDLKHCEPETVLGAFMAAASLGLEPNTPLQQAFLIPRKRNFKDKETNTWKTKMECTFQIGNRGFLYLSYQSPSIFAITTNVIYRGESFKYDSGQAFLTHEPSLERETDDADFDNIIASYCVVMFTENPNVKIPIVVPRGDLIKIRESSDTYRYLRDAIAAAGNDAKEKLKAEKLFADTAWVKWAKPMCMKSSIKQACKQLPLTTQMKRAAQLDDFSEIGKLDLRSIAFIKDSAELDAVVSATALPAPSETEKPLPSINLNDKKQPQPIAAKNSAPKPNQTMDGPPPGHPASFNQHDTGGF